MTLLELMRSPSLGKIASLVLVSSLIAACTPPGQSPSNQAERTATLTRGTLTATVSATGSVKPEAEIRLTFQQVGTVAEILVSEGQTVQKGDVIARLDTKDFELAVLQAQSALEQAKTAAEQAKIGVENAKVQRIIATANYSRTVGSVRASDVTAARAALAAAEANLAKLEAGPTPEELAAAEANLRNAEALLRQAQSAYDLAFSLNPAGIGASPQALQLEQATNNFNAAKAQYDRIAKGADEAQLKAARQQVETARANLDKLLTPVRDFDLQQAEAQLQQAEIALKNAELQAANAQNQVRIAELQLSQAQRRLEQASLKSPINGVVSSISFKVGELVGAQSSVVVVDTSRYYVDVTVDEVDVARVQAGQKVEITLDSLPGVTLSGKIARISPTSRIVNGVVSYDVRVDVDTTDAPLRSGMTANATIVLERRENVVLVPNWAVRRDRETGKTFITVREGDQTREVEVQLGLRNDTFSEALSGADAGMIVLPPRNVGLFAQ